MRWRASSDFAKFVRIERRSGALRTASINSDVALGQHTAFRRAHLCHSALGSVQVHAANTAIKVLPSFQGVVSLENCIACDLVLA